jgi:hypothetical protein
VDLIKEGDDISRGIFEALLDISVWFWYFVGRQRKTDFLETTILNIPNFLQITGGCYRENAPLKVDDSIMTFDIY